jgi:PadR family transcriptional regulator PadR
MENTQVLKGVLDLAVMALVAESDTYGYDVVRRLRGAGIGEVGDASVYGTLRRLYAAGALTSYVVPSEEGPHRKYYGLTTRGRDQLRDDVATWRGFSAAMERLVSSATPSAAATERMRVVGRPKRAVTAENVTTANVTTGNATTGEASR